MGAPKLQTQGVRQCRSLLRSDTAGAQRFRNSLWQCVKKGRSYAAESETGTRQDARIARC